MEGRSHRAPTGALRALGTAGDMVPPSQMDRSAEKGEREAARRSLWTPTPSVEWGRPTQKQVRWWGQGEEGDPMGVSLGYVGMRSHWTSAKEQNSAA